MDGVGLGVEVDCGLRSAYCMEPERHSGSFLVDYAGRFIDQDSAFGWHMSRM